jgi:cytochrome P450
MGTDMAANGTPRVVVQQVADREALISGFAEVTAFLTDPTVSADPNVDGALHPRILTEEPALSVRRGVSMQLCDGTQHARLRRTFATALTTRRCAAPLRNVETSTQRLADALVQRGSGELIEDVIAPVVGELAGDLLGVSPSNRDTVLSHVDVSVKSEIDPSLAGMRDLDDDMEALLAEKTAQPTEDLASTLAAARTAGELSDAEALGTASLMAVAGYEPTVSFLAMATLTLLLAPQLRRMLLEQPDAMPTAIEELLRFITPTKRVWVRVTRQEIALAGVTIPAGCAVEVDLLAANRDPARFAEPDVLNPFRGDDKHLSFGHGAHFCPGATLARRASAAALTALLPRLEVLALTRPVTDLEWYESRMNRRPAILPVTRIGTAKG